MSEPTTHGRGTRAAHVPGSSDRVAHRLPLVILGFSSAFFVTFGGQLYVGEILLLILVPVAFFSARLWEMPQTKKLYVLLAGWVVGLVSAGVLNHATTTAITSSVASAVMFIVSVTCVSFLTRDSTDFIALFFGMALGYAAACLVQPDKFFAEAPWKFGFALPATLIGIIVIQHLRVRPVRIVAFVLLASVSLLNDYRTMALFVLFLAAWQCVPSGARSRLRNASPRSLLIVAPLALGTALGVAALYSNLARSGALGSAAQLRLSLQGGGSPWLMILGGRNEVFYSIPGALARPIIGYGPDAHLPLWLSTLADRNLANLGFYQIAQETRSNDLIPTHSVVMGAWIESGVLGLVCWLVVLFVLLAALPVALSLSDRVWPLFVFVLTESIWSIFFSPFGGTTRFFIAVSVCIALYVLHRQRITRAQTVPTQRKVVIDE